MCRKHCGCEIYRGGDRKFKGWSAGSVSVIWEQERSETIYSQGL